MALNTLSPSEACRSSLGAPSGIGAICRVLVIYKRSQRCTGPISFPLTAERRQVSHSRAGGPPAAAQPCRGRHASTAPAAPRPLWDFRLVGADGGGLRGAAAARAAAVASAAASVAATALPLPRRAMPTVEELYRNYGILADATETAGQVRRGCGLQGLGRPGARVVRRGALGWAGRAAGGATLQWGLLPCWLCAGFHGSGQVVKRPLRLRSRGVGGEGSGAAPAVDALRLDAAI